MLLCPLQTDVKQLSAIVMKLPHGSACDFVSAEEWQAVYFRQLQRNASQLHAMSMSCIAEADLPNL